MAKINDGKRHLSPTEFLAMRFLIRMINDDILGHGKPLTEKVRDLTYNLINAMNEMAAMDETSQSN